MIQTTAPQQTTWALKLGKLKGQPENLHTYWKVLSLKKGGQACGRIRRVYCLRHSVRK